MRTFGILVLIGVLGSPLVATAAEESAQQTSQERVRSMARTWSGVGLIVAGTVLASTQEEVCIVGFGFLAGFSGCDTSWHKPLGVTGIGLATVGVLLATVWSDVPGVRNMTIAPTRGGLQVGASFGF